MSRIIPTGKGEFVAARLSELHVTIWVEGRDGDRQSVSGTSLDLGALDTLIRRLTNLREALTTRVTRTEISCAR